MKNTEHSRMRNSVDEFTAALEDFTALLDDSKNIDQRKAEYVSAVGHDSPINRLAAGKHFDDAVGNEAFTDTIKSTIQKLLDFVMAWVLKAKSFFVSHLGVSVKRIERMRDSIKRSPKFRNMEDINVSLPRYALRSMAYTHKLENPSYLHLTDPPCGAELTDVAKFVSDFSIRLAGINVRASSRELLSDQAMIGFAVEGIHRCIDDAAEWIKQNMNGDITITMDEDRPYTFKYTQAGLEKKIEKFGDEEIEYNINPKLFVDGVKVWSESMKFSKIVVKGTEKTAAKMKELAAQTKDISPEQVELINNMLLGVRNVNQALKFITDMASDSLQATYKVMSIIARECGVLVVAVNVATESIKEDSEGAPVALEDEDKVMIGDLIAHLESIKGNGGLTPIEANVVNDMAKSIYDKFGLEDFEVLPEYFYEPAHRQEGTQLFIDKLASVMA